MATATPTEIFRDSLIRSLADPALRPLADKVISGEPLTYDDGVTLYASRDLHGIGRLANLVRERLHGGRAFYNRNRHINYTNVCALSCKFCSFYRKRGEEGAYEMPVEQVVETARKADQGVRPKSTSSAACTRGSSSTTTPTCFAGSERLARRCTSRRSRRSRLSIFPASRE